MDLLSQRYANPYMILDDFIRLGQLYDFSTETLKTISEEKIQELRWQYYLHRVYDMTYEDYVAKCEAKPEKYSMNHKQMETVLKSSEDILEGFKM